MAKIDVHSTSCKEKIRVHTRKMLKELVRERILGAMGNLQRNPLIVDHQIVAPSLFSGIVYATVDTQFWSSTI